MIIEGNGHDKWNGQPAMGTVGMRKGKMGMEVENGARWRWPCAWGFMHASMKWMWWLKRENVVTGSWGLLHRGFLDGLSSKDATSQSKQHY